MSEGPPESQGEQSLPPGAESPRKRGPVWRYSLRGLLILTAVAALGSAWIAREYDRYRSERRAMDRLLPFARDIGAIWTGPAWISQRDGTFRFFNRFRTLWLLGDVVTDEDVKSVEVFRELEELGLNSRRITDDGLDSVANRERLKALSLSRIELSPRRLAALAANSKLESLSLSSMPLSVEHCRALAKLPKLRELALGDLRLSAAAIDELAQLPALEVLTLVGVECPAQSLSRLRAENPALRVEEPDHW